MKRVILVLFMILATVSNVSAYTDSVENRTVKIAVSEFPPYLSESLNSYGYVVKVITEAFATVGIKVEYSFFPSNSAREAARIGRFDATGVWFDTEDRRKDFYISAPIVDSTYLLYYLKEKPINWKTLKDLKGLKVGVTFGESYGEDFDRAVKNGEITVIRAESDEISLKNLARGRLDAVPLDEVVSRSMIDAELSSADVARIGNNPVQICTKPLNLLISRKVNDGEELLRLFNQGLSTIRKNGTWDKIMNDKTYGQKK